MILLTYGTRPESINQSGFLVKDPSDLTSSFNNHINDFRIKYSCPYGDGDSSQKISDLLGDI